MGPSRGGGQVSGWPCSLAWVAMIPQFLCHWRHIFSFSVRGIFELWS